MGCAIPTNSKKSQYVDTNIEAASRNEERKEAHQCRQINKLSTLFRRKPPPTYLATVTRISAGRVSSDRTIFVSSGRIEEKSIGRELGLNDQEIDIVEMTRERISRMNQDLRVDIS